MNEIYVWLAQLGTPSQADWDMLDLDERQRAGRFRLAQHRTRFVSAHAIARRILARHMGVPAGQIQIAADRWGKPYIAGPLPTDLCFNLSHSGDRLLCGLCVGLAIGVDLELHHEDLAWRQVAGDHFSRRELAFLETLESEAARRAAFYRLWTLKEAYLKAVGRGLRAGLEQVEVNCAAAEPAAFLSLPGGEYEKQHWQAFGIQPASAVSGAVVVAKSQTGAHLVQLSWDERTA